MPGVGITVRLSQPLLRISVWDFLIYLMCRNCSPSFQVSFRGDFSICSCRSGVSVRGSQFRILLHCHLELELAGTRLFRLYFIIIK